MATSTKYTRMDLTAQYGGVAVRCWSGHWQEGDMPDQEIFREGVTLDQACMALEDAGWSVVIFTSRNSNQTARALRGDITRVDFYLTSQGLAAKHYPYGWKANTRPIRVEHWPVDQFESQVEDYQARGWTVRVWRNGARAFKGAPEPVRNQNEIMVLRHRVEKDFQHGEHNDTRNYNLAYDF
ncbi:MAG TPA: hypothetical protein VIH16_03645 [Bellilinea sp.]